MIKAKPIILFKNPLTSKLNHQNFKDLNIRYLKTSIVDPKIKNKLS